MSKKEVKISVEKREDLELDDLYTVDFGDITVSVHADSEKEALELAKESRDRLKNNSAKV